MAQIVKANAGETGALQQGHELPEQEVASILWLPELVGEDEIVVVPLVAEKQTHLGLSGTMPAQGIAGEVGEFDLAPRAGGLRLGDDELTVEPALESARDVDRAAVEINVAPAKREQLTASHARADGDRDDCLKWPLLRRLEQHTYLIRVQDRHLNSADTWRVDQVSNVARHEVPAHRLAERRVKRRVEVMHRGRTEAGTEAALVETRQVLWRQPADLHVADHRHDVNADVLLAPAPGCRAQLGSSPLEPRGKE